MKRVGLKFVNQLRPKMGYCFMTAAVRVLSFKIANFAVRVNESNHPFNSVAGTGSHFSRLGCNCSPNSAVKIVVNFDSHFWVAGCLSIYNSIHHSNNG